MTVPAALLREALDWLDVHRIDIILAPVEGTWRLMLDGQPATTGDVVAKAVGLGMFGGSGRVQ